MSHSFMQIARGAARAVLPQSLRESIVHRYNSALNTYYSMTDFERTCHVRKHDIRLNISSYIEDYRARTYETKEPETLDWIEEHLGEGDVFMDVGANIGLYSLFAAKLRPTASIFAFEPEAKNFNRLCKNISSNHVENIVPCNFPLSDSQSFDYFFVHDSQPGSALHSFGQPSDFANGFGKAVKFKQGALSMSLDDFCDLTEVRAPNLLKIDVDGIELKILFGASQVLNSETLRTVLIEANDIDGEGVEIATTLERHGFRLKEKSLWQATQGGKTSQNMIFVRENSSASVQVDCEVGNE